MSCRKPVCFTGVLFRILKYITRRKLSVSCLKKCTQLASSRVSPPNSEKSAYLWLTWYDTVYVVYADCGWFSKINIFYIVVYHGKCGCGNNLYVDGLAEGVLNMGTYLVSHRLLADYLHSFLLNGYVSNMVAKKGSINQINLVLIPDPTLQAGGSLLQGIIK